MLREDIRCDSGVRDCVGGDVGVHAQAPAGQPPAGGVRGQGRGDAPPPAPMAIKQVKPGLYMVTGIGGNSTVRVGNQGIILVDTKNLGDQFYNDLVAQIKTVSDQPVKHVFVTHVHQDHSGNIGRSSRRARRSSPTRG